MVPYLISIVLQIIILVLYLKIADHFNIIDKPNVRSSHSYITIRGGGIIFPIAALLWFLIYGFGQPWIIISLFLLASISFIDDINTVSSKLRIIVHFAAVSVLFWQLQIFGLSIYLILLAFIITIGWINAFNFMDGINGITAVYSFVTLSTFAWLNHSIQFVSPDLLILLIISVLIFSFFNVRKIAKTFAGDVGSVSMAFLLAWFLISLMFETRNIVYIMLFALYGIDSVITILIRLWQRENIFEAHRSHLYQYLSNELEWPHIKVSFIYGLIQASINIVVIFLISTDKMTLTLFLIFLMFLTSSYLIVRIRIFKLIKTLKE